MHVDPSTLDSSAVDAKTGGGSLPSTTEFIVNALPTSFIGAFAENSCSRCSSWPVWWARPCSTWATPRCPQVLPAVEQAQEIIFAIVGFIMRLAPIAVFGAMARLIGQYGLGGIGTYAKLIACATGPPLLFVALLAVALKAVTGLSLWKFLRYIREEMLLALGTASTETVMPRVMQKLRKAGARDDAVGLVLPTGYSFNLDGASLYLSIGTLFIAQAVGVDLSLGQQITVVLVLMLTSKGMAGVPGSAFLALSATASSLGAIPAGAVALLLGVDRIMDSMRVVTNLLGNCVAVFAVSRWEGALDTARGEEGAGRRDRRGEPVETVAARGARRTGRETTARGCGRVGLPARSPPPDGQRRLRGRGKRARPRCCLSSGPVGVHQRVQQPAEHLALLVRQGSQDLLRGRPSRAAQLAAAPCGPSSVSSIRITRRLAGSGARRTLPLASSASTSVVTARGHHLEPLREIRHARRPSAVRQRAQQPGLGRGDAQRRSRCGASGRGAAAGQPQQLLGEQAAASGRGHAGQYQD